MTAHGELIALLVDVASALAVSPMAKSSVRFDRVLCAVTFSPHARRVVAWAASLAASNGGEVRLFHALPGPEPHGVDGSEPDSERVLKKLFGLTEQLPGRPRVSAAVTEGDAVDEILRHARMIHADLIAVGMHAQDGDVSPLITRLAIDAPCPVLVVDETTPSALEVTGVNDIVVAVDFLPASLAATEYALGLAQVIEARVTAVHVLRQDVMASTPHKQGVEEMPWNVQQRLRQGLLEFAMNESSSSSLCSAVVISGRPYVEIVRVAATRDAGLIVMGIDDGPDSHEEFGETASCVMQFAQRTVLLVPERARPGGA